MERLCTDYAVERLLRQRGSIYEIADDRGARIRCVDVEHVDLRDERVAGSPRRAESAGVSVVSELEDVAPYVPAGVATEEILDVIPVDREPTIESVVLAYRRDPAQAAETNRAHRWAHTSQSPADSPYRLHRGSQAALHQARATLPWARTSELSARTSCHAHSATEAKEGVIRPISIGLLPGPTARPDVVKPAS